MKFSKAAKLEMIKQVRSEDALLSMLSGIILSCGSLIVSRKQISFELSSELRELLEFTKSIILKNFKTSDDDIRITDLGGKGKFMLSVTLFLGQQVLDFLGIVRFDANGLAINRAPSKSLLADDECKRAFLAGAFVGAGSVSTPSESASGYHLEWVSQTEEKADSISNLLGEFNVISKKVQRGESSIVYIKGSDEICRALVVMGAPSAMLKIETGKVEREVRNNINRQVNCEAANLDKIMAASANEVKAIETIKETIGLDGLPQNLRDVAQIRAKNPQASLAQICRLLGDNISRTGVSLRLKKLVKIAQDLGDNYGE